MKNRRCGRSYRPYPSRTSIFRPGNPSMRCIVHPYYILYRKEGNVIMKRFRYTKIKEIVQSRPIETQEELAKACRKKASKSHRLRFPAISKSSCSSRSRPVMAITATPCRRNRTCSCPRTAWPACSRTPSSASIRRITRSSSIPCRVRPIPLPPPSTMPAGKMSSAPWPATTRSSSSSRTRKRFRNWSNLSYR